MTGTFLQRPVVQYAWVVDNLEDACRHWSTLFGAGPFYLMRHHQVPGAYSYRGSREKGDVSYAFGYSGEDQIQLIELHDDVPSHYHEVHPRGSTGFHHIGILSPDFEGDKRRMAEHGLEIVTTLWSGAEIAYLDARAQIGSFVEIIEDTPDVRDFWKVWKQAHDAWDGTTAPIREAGELY